MVGGLGAHALELAGSGVCGPCCLVAFVALPRAQLGECVGCLPPECRSLSRVLGLLGECGHLGVDDLHGDVVDQTLHRFRS